jgi:peptide-methionine (R)-S-oxide reductase
MTGKFLKSEKVWRKDLSPERYYVMREKGTEVPFTGKYYKSKGTGIYHCAACDNPLFSSDTKYDSGTGWPSFYKALNGSIEEKPDADGVRTEVLCVKCGSHLGHVFKDGPAPSGLRYCMNSIALELEKNS